MESSIGGKAADTLPLYEFVEDVFESGFGPYDYAKSVWLGNPDPALRLAGEHPWPSREHDGETFVYSVPVHAGFSAVRGTALFIGKDPWRDQNDPRSWLVAEADLRTGLERDHKVLSSSVDAARQLWLQLAPSNFDNMPGWARRREWPPPTGRIHSSGLNYDPHPRDQIRIEGRLTPEYYLAEAELRNGLRSNYSFEDIAVFESMTRMVQEVKNARDGNERLMLRKKALAYEQGRRALAATHALVA